MGWLVGLVVVVAVGVAVWAVAVSLYLARLAGRAQAEALATRRALVDAVLRAADEQAAKEAALRQLAALRQVRAAELLGLAADVEALGQQYRRVQQLFDALQAGDRCSRMN